MGYSLWSRKRTRHALTTKQQYMFNQAKGKVWEDRNRLLILVFYWLCHVRVSAFWEVIFLKENFFNCQNFKFSLKYWCEIFFFFERLRLMFKGLIESDHRFPNFRRTVSPSVKWNNIELRCLM